MFLNPLEHAYQVLEKAICSRFFPDDPNVRLSFLGLLEEDRNEKELSQLAHIGTCGIHTLHNSMKHGEKASDWNVKSKKADYEAFTQAISSDYPLQFCANRWVENGSVSMRTRKIWPKVVEIINFWKGLLKSKKPGKERLEQTPVMIIFVRYRKTH